MQHAAAGIRSIPAVAAFDTKDVLAEFGFKVASPAAIAAARALTTSLVDDAVHACDQQLGALEAIGQNPYRERLSLGTRVLRHAAPIELFEPNDIAARIERAFAEPAGMPRPDMATMSGRVLAELAKRLTAHGFDLAAAERHDDGSLSRIALVDPVYAEQANRQDSTIDDSSLAAALARLDDAPVEAPTLPTGIRSVQGTRSAAEIQTFVSEFADRAVGTVRDHFRGMLAAQLPLFEEAEGTHYHEKYMVIVDAERVKTSSETHYLPQSAEIYLDGFDKLMERVEKQFEGRASFDREPFALHLCRAAAERLRGHPELRVALVGQSRDKFIGDTLEWGFVVVCGPTLPKVTPFLTRVARALMPWTNRPAALAAPAPLALPAPIAPAQTTDFALPREHG